MDEALQAIPGWVDANDGLIWTVASISAAMFVVSLVAVPFLLSWIPEDYFLRPPGTYLPGWFAARPTWGLMLRATRNLLGLLLILAGASMLVLPGQGVLTILAGLMLLDLPGKRDMEVSLLRRPHVFRAVNWLRKQRHCPPLQLPPRRRRWPKTESA